MQTSNVQTTILVVKLWWSLVWEISEIPRRRRRIGLSSWGRTKGFSAWEAIYPTPLVLPDRATQVCRTTILYGIVWQAQQRLGNARIMHGRWNRHVGLTASGHTCPVIHPSANLARCCLTLVIRPRPSARMKYGIWKGINCNLESGRCSPDKRVHTEMKNG